MITCVYEYVYVSITKIYTFVLDKNRIKANYRLGMQYLCTGNQNTDQQQ